MLRRFRPGADLDDVAAVCADAEVMRFIGTGRTLTRSETRGLLATIERHWDDHGFGLWAVDVDGEVAGFCGLAVPSFLPQVLPAVECGWRLGRPWRGRGLATEAARAALGWGWAELGLAGVVSIIATGARAACGWPRSSACAAGRTAAPRDGPARPRLRARAAVRERAATLDDAPAFGALIARRLRVLPGVPAGRVGAAGRRGETARSAQRLARPETWARLAFDGATPAGCVLFEPAPGLPGVAHLANLFVDPGLVGHRARGAPARPGRGAPCASGAIARAGFFTPEAHARARRFFEREGWRPAGPPRWEELLGMLARRVPHRARRRLDWETAGHPRGRQASTWSTSRGWLRAEVRRPRKTPGKTIRADSHEYALAV